MTFDYCYRICCGSSQSIVRDSSKSVSWNSSVRLPRPSGSVLNRRECRGCMTIHQLFLRAARGVVRLGPGRATSLTSGATARGGLHRLALTDELEPFVDTAPYDTLVAPATSTHNGDLGPREQVTSTYYPNAVGNPRPSRRRAWYRASSRWRERERASREPPTVSGSGSLYPLGGL
jgi:hypothetical protein